MVTTQGRAGVYERVSNAKDKRARSVAEQNAENRTACADQGWAIAATFQDPNRGASRFTARAREAYEQLLAAIGAGQIDVLVLWESSRGGRELQAWAGLLNACRQHRVRIYVTSHGRLYDMASGRDWRTLAEDGVDSAFEIGEDIAADPARDRGQRGQRPAARPGALRLPPHLRPADRQDGRAGTRPRGRPRRR